MSTPVQILGLGNPLLDITVSFLSFFFVIVSILFFHLPVIVDVDPKFLEKYELDANLQYTADEKTLPLFVLYFF